MLSLDKSACNCLNTETLRLIGCTTHDFSNAPGMLSGEPGAPSMVRSASPTCRRATTSARQASTELWRPQREESHVRLYRNAHEVGSVPTEIPLHDRTVPVSCHPHERSSSTASARSADNTGVRTGTTRAEEGRSTVRRTQESHRSSPPAPAQIEVRPRTVLPGGHCPKHQTAGLNS